MAHIRSSSDLQRNISAIYDLCDRTGEPVYVPRNGAASLVVMEADSFESLLEHQDELERELRIYKALMQSEIERLSRRTFSWDDVKRDRAALNESIA